MIRAITSCISEQQCIFITHLVIYLHTNTYAQTYKTNEYKHTHTRIYTVQYKSLIYDFMFILLIKDSKIFLGVCYNYQYRVKKKFKK